jgi:hypothetical protein
MAGAQVTHGLITQTMVYARFHPNYGDYDKFTSAVQELLPGGQSPTPQTTPP